MEIHLILEGEQVGPLSEAQVRQYLDDGLVNTTDLATYEGMPDWMPLDQLLAQLPPYVPPATVEPVAASAAGVEPAETPFLIGENATPVQEELALPLTASQRTKRKAGKIVIQPIQPIETKLPQARKTGKTAITLEPMRSTISLPPITGHLPRVKPPGKGTGRTGKVSLRVAPEQPALIPAPAPEPTPPPEPAPQPEPAPAAITAEPIAPIEPPASIPAESTVAPTPPVAPVIPAKTVEIPVEPVAAAISPKPTVPPEPVPTTASQKLPNPPPVFSVLPMGSGFMPPTMRSVNPPVRRKKKGPFPYKGVALAAFIILVLVICLALVASRGGVMPTPSPFAPQRTPAPPFQSMNKPPDQPTTVAELSDRGIKRQAAGDLDGAIQDFDAALALDPKAVEVLYQRGLAKQAKQDLPGATADYTQVIALDPKRANAFSNRGFIKQAQLDLDGALADYAYALAIDPKLPVVYNNIGLIKAKRGDLDGAIASYGKAIDLDPQMAFALYNRGVAKNTEGNPDGALADFTQAIGVNPKIALAYRDRGTVRQAKGDSEGALADFTQAIELDPSLIDAYLSRGQIRLRRGDFNGTVDDDNKIVTLDPKVAAAYYQRGLANVGKNRPAAAVTDFKAFGDLAPRDPAADSARLFTWAMAKESNPDGDADTPLAVALQNEWNSPPEDLTSKIASFLVGHLNENDLIKNAAPIDPANAPAAYVRVWYFLGMKRLLAGDTAGAVSAFQKSVATGQKDAPEYVFAQAELQAQNPSAQN